MYNCDDQSCFLKVVCKLLRVFYGEVAPKNSWASKFFELSVKKEFPFSFVTFVQLLSYPHGLKGFIKRYNVDHFKSSIAIVLGGNVCLDFITFAVPKKIKKEVIHLFYNFRIGLKRRQKMDYLGGNQTLKNC